MSTYRLLVCTTEKKMMEDCPEGHAMIRKKMKKSRAKGLHDDGAAIEWGYEPVYEFGDASVPERFMAVGTPVKWDQETAEEEHARKTKYLKLVPVAIYHGLRRSFFRGDVVDIPQSVNDELLEGARARKKVFAQLMNPDSNPLVFANTFLKAWSESGLDDRAVEQAE